MNPDNLLVLGLVLAVLSVPAIVSAVSDGKAPRAAMITLMAGGGLLVIAMMNKPGGYTIQEIPSVVSRVVGSLV